MANMTPQAKRLIMLGLVGIVLVGGAYVVNTYFLAPSAPPPAPPVRPMLPPPPKSPVAEPAPVPGASALPAKPQIAVPSPGLGTPTSPAPPKPGMAAPAPGGYTVQVGAFAVKANAEKMQKRLEEKGHPVTIRQGSSSKVSGHRVLVGEYAERADAQAQRDKVAAAGSKGAKVVPMAAGKFTVEAGTFKNLDAAIDLSRELQQSGLVSRIDSRPTAGTGLYQVQVGRYATKEDAESQVAALRKEGLSPIVMKN